MGKPGERVQGIRKEGALSNRSACTSQSYEPSHVLKAMNLPDWRVRGAIRISWCHTTEDVNWAEVVRAIKALY